jgi:hypothetical protein
MPSGSAAQCCSSRCSDTQRTRARKLSGSHEVIHSTGIALQRFQGQKVERLWRSVEHEEVYLRAYDTVAEARTSLAKYFNFYNAVSYYPTRLCH